MLTNIHTNTVVFFSIRDNMCVYGERDRGRVDQSVCF